MSLVQGHWHHLYQRLLIIDCRYPYEYEGGHLPGAINVNTLEAIDEMLFAAAEGMADTILVFHCEFSSERAPRMALHVRNKDRLLNAHRYPHLQYPEVYILEGGYKNFFLTHPDHCEPAGCYMPMRNPKHREELRFHQRMKHTMLGGQKHRTKLRTVSLGSLAMGKAVRNADWQMPHFVPSQEALHAMDICYDENMPSSDGLEISCNATYHL